MNKKDLLTEQIIDEISDMDIAGYLKEEIEKILGYFHYYKLKNIHKNIDFLKDYLSFLDQKNYKQMGLLQCDGDMEIEVTGHDLYYYISQKGLDFVGEKKIKQKIWQNDYSLNSIMLGIKGFLLLTMDEFCNASPVRLSISKLVWDKETATNKT
ncbi:MAG TPA: hypothetical protein PK674_00090 [Candidatus Absconditabacterales bacterium]|nr:hypothetical protein [Candidatus Absconditabacterales bacterium]HOQ78662.1 hypothetical protein [Candidatus Absconditabacterales bacterium]HPK27781.1 hypothetical protein [Candidatus Absconditabacterales bacterium]